LLAAAQYLLLELVALNILFFSGQIILHIIVVLVLVLVSVAVLDFLSKRADLLLTVRPEVLVPKFSTLVLEKPGPHGPMLLLHREEKLPNTLDLGLGGSVTLYQVEEPGKIQVIQILAFCLAPRLDRFLRAEHLELQFASLK